LRANTPLQALTRARAARRRFAAGEAPEQVHARASQQSEGGDLALGDDEVHSFLEQLTTLAKVRTPTRRRCTT
jgi:hypothetical protein